MVKKLFKSIGLKSADANPNLFIGNEAYILLFINDMLIVGKRRHLNITKLPIPTGTVLKPDIESPLKYNDATNTIGYHSKA